MSMRYTLLYIVGLLCFTVQGVKAQSQVDSRIAVNQQVDDKTFVVIIANEHYKHEESVPYALNDGEVFKVYCQKTLGIPEKNIKYVPDATLGEVNFALYWLDNVLKAYDGSGRAFVYYSGHGMPDEKGSEAYLLPVDGFSQSTEGALSTRALYKKLGKMSSHQIVVFLDACFSGAKRDGQMLASSRGVAIRPKVSMVEANTVVFSAAQGDETAYPFRQGQHGLFTYHLLEKLQQSGGCVTLGELSDYVTQKVKRQAVLENNGKPQTPTVVAAQQNADWRQWQLAAVAAKDYETRNPTVANNNIAPAGSPSGKEKRNQAIAPAGLPSGEEKHNQAIVPAGSSSGKQMMKASPVVADLITQGKKAVRAMDYQKAKECFTKAADQFDTEAYYQLGLLYANSNYDGYDKEKATTYFLKAANHQHLEGMYQAGMILLGSDNAAAKVWLGKAAGRGHAAAAKQLSRLK